MDSANTEKLIAAMPKAELHLHLEGAIEPSTVVELAARHGVALTLEEVKARYAYDGFLGFLEAFKWVTSFLRTPADHALITERLAERLISQNVLYAEVTFALGVMQWRKQDALANLLAIAEAGRRAEKKGLRMQWIPDATRQFGPESAMAVARIAVQAGKPQGVVAFGMGGDELAVPAAEFRRVYEYAASAGLHRVVHAGEVGGPESVSEAVEILGAQRIGHGIGVMHSVSLMEMLAERQIPLEICPTSNICTGALARQLGRDRANLEEHPLPDFFRRGLPVTLSSDDPAMFHTDLVNEYRVASRLGMADSELAQLAAMSFEHAFLSAEEKRLLLAEFHNRMKSLSLV